MPHEYEARFVLTPEEQYRRMASEAVYSLARESRAARMNVHESTNKLADDCFGFSVVPCNLQEHPLNGPSLVCDVDVHFNADLPETLLSKNTWEVAARPATSAMQRDESMAAWGEVKDRMGVYESAVLLNDGVVFLRTAAARDLSQRWVQYMLDVADRCEDVLDSQAGPRRGRYFWTMYAFSCWAADRLIRFLESDEVSFGWDGEKQGAIAHWGTRYWHSILEE